MEYNLQGRLARVSADQGGAVTVSDYAYNDSGMRVEQAITENSVTTTTRYVLDASNPTGYVQVLEETDATGAVTKSYTVGLDVLAQATLATGSLTVAYDAHGSTRALLDSLGAIATNAAASNAVQIFTFDAYGVAVGFDAIASLTTLLYSGEQTDPTGMQYLRARYYDAATGRFDRLDSYSGDASRAQSYHKYLYTHANPVMGIDPSGSMLVDNLGAVGIMTLLAGILLVIPGCVSYPHPVTEIEAAAVPALHKELALLSYDAYNDDASETAGWMPLTDLELDKLKLPQNLNSHGLNWYSAVDESVYRKGNRYVLAFRGTEADPWDWGTNLFQALLGISLQYNAGVNLAVELKKNLPKGSTLLFTGHSLGGGVHFLTRHWAGSLKAQHWSGNLKAEAIAYYLRGEPLTALQHELLLPGVPGSLAGLQPARGDEPLRFGRHSMINLLRAMGVPVPQ